MSVDTDCLLVVIGPAQELEAFEATQTARFHASMVAGFDTWDHGGWPGKVRRRRAPSGDRVLYSFSMKSNPIQWVEIQAPGWPELAFVAHCLLEGVNELPILYREQFARGGFIRAEHLREGEADRDTLERRLAESDVELSTLEAEFVVVSMPAE